MSAKYEDFMGAKAAMIKANARLDEKECKRGARWAKRHGYTVT